MLVKTMKELEDYILQFPAHKDISVDKSFFNKEALQQFKSVWGDDDGQIANYRQEIEKNGAGIHIKEYDDFYKIHWDKSNPATDPLGHLIKDAPHHIPTVVLGFLFALAVGYVATRK